MDNNDNDYSQQQNKGPGFLQDLTLISIARSGVVQDLNRTQQQNKAIADANEKLQSDLAEQQKKAKAIQNDAEEEVGDLQRTVIKLRRELLRLNNLLNLPLEEIAKQHPGFAKNYEKQMEMLAEWMVSQKAFKETAIEFGTEKGLSVEDVIQHGSVKRMDVLNNSHDEAHNTNIEGSNVVTPERAKKLKEKIEQQASIPAKGESLERIKKFQGQTVNGTRNKLTI